MGKCEKCEYCEKLNGNINYCKKANIFVDTSCEGCEAEAIQEIKKKQRRWNITALIAAILLNAIIIGNVLILSGEAVFSFHWWLILVDLFAVSVNGATIFNASYHLNNDR